MRLSTIKTTLHSDFANQDSSLRLLRKLGAITISDFFQSLFSKNSNIENRSQLQELRRLLEIKFQLDSTLLDVMNSNSTELRKSGFDNTKITLLTQLIEHTFPGTTEYSPLVRSLNQVHISPNQIKV